MFVEAPPGTGISAVACGLLLRAVKLKKRSLCCTFSQEALFVLVEKFHERCSSEIIHDVRVVVAASLQNKRFPTTYTGLALDRRDRLYKTLQSITRVARGLIRVVPRPAAVEQTDQRGGIAVSTSAG